jgi:hypothetical protein
MNHFVTCYLQQANEVISFKAISKCDVPQFIEEHQHVSTIVVCDPRMRSNTTYQYGKIKKMAS